MDVPNSVSRRDKFLQVVRQDSKPLAIKHRLSCKADDIDSIEEAIDLQKRLGKISKRYPKKNKTAASISYGYV